VISNFVPTTPSRFSEATGRVRIVSGARDRTLKYVVADGGPGIREDALDRIFERFFYNRPAASGVLGQIRDSSFRSQNRSWRPMADE